jgi:TatD DNase family protein
MCQSITTENIKTIQQLPLDKIMIETDSPWCEIRPSHASYKFIKTHFKSVKKEKHDPNLLVKSRNEPCLLIQVLECIAGIKGLDIGIVEKACFENTCKVFPQLEYSIDVICHVPLTRYS